MLLPIAIHVKLLDTFDCKSFVPQSKLIGFRRKFVGECDHNIRECSGEEDNLDCFR